MKKIGLLIFTVFLMFGCIAEQGKVAIDIKRKIKSSSNPSTLASASVSNIQIINNQLVITGSGLNDVTAVKVDGNSLNQSFTIETKSATQIIANAVSAFSFDVSKVFNLILSDASAAATFPIDFSLCNATLNGHGFNCAITASDKDVLSYDAVSGKWKPRAINGLSYQGAWNANDPEPAGASSGDYYIVSVANAPYALGDWIVWNGTGYDRINNSTTITSVFGRTGVVTATEGDYNLDKLLDVDLTVPATIGKVLKYDGMKWIAGDDLSGGGAGSVTSTEIAALAVTDAKIDSVSASKITGTITSAQIADGTIVNADINAAAAIDYSKLNIPNTTIPYAKLNIADGDIPAAKISGLPSATVVLATTITDADTTHAPDGNAVFDALGLKLNLTGGTLSVGTISGVPAPTNADDVVNKAYADLKIPKTAIPTCGVGEVLKSDGTSFTCVTDNTGAGAFSGTGSRAVQTAAGGALEVSATTSTELGYVSGVTSAIQTQLDAKQATITAGTTLQYYRGDKTFVTLDTAVVPENTNLYFTEPRVLATDLLGLNTGIAGPITATDDVLGAMGKLQYQVTDLKANGQWIKTVNDISYAAGNVTIEKKLLLKDTGSNFVEIKAPATVTSTYTLTMPTTDGDANQVLKTDGSGILSWADLTDTSVQAFAKAALPTCGAGEVLKSNGTVFSCVTDNAGAGAFSGTASRAVATGAGGALEVSATTATELGYVSGVTSAIQTQLNAKEGTITAGTAAQYYRGDKTFVTLDTSMVPENTNLYFTTARAKAATVADAIANAVVDVAPSQNAVFDALATKLNTTGGTLTVGTISGVPTPTNADDVVNKGYVDGLTGQWTTSGADIYRATGNVGIGTATPVSKLHVSGAPVATTQYGLISLGNGAYDGVTAGYFLGRAQGTVHAINMAAGYTGNLVHYTANDASSAKFIVKYDGSVEAGRASATGANSASFGGLNTASGGYAVALGHFTTASGNFSTSSGLGSSATASSSSSFGENTTSNSYGMMAVGLYNIVPTGVSTTAWQSTDPVFVVGNGVSGTPSNALTILKSGNVGIGTTAPTEKLDVVGNANVSGKVRLKDSGVNFVEIKAPAAATATYTLTMPTTDGDANQVLKTDGSGILSWVDLTDTSVQAFAKAALPTCGAGEVLKSNGTSFSCVTDNPGSAAFSGTASRAIASGAGGALEVSATTATELGYVSGVTSAIQTQLDSKQATITAGTTLQYYRGDKTFVTLDTAVVPENTNLYFTTVRARTASVADAIADAVLDIAPSQNAVFDALATKLNLTGGTLSVGTISGVPTPTNADDVANKGYIDSLGQWTKGSGANAADIYRSAGNVGIGTTTPANPLQVIRDNTATSGEHTLASFLRQSSDPSALVIGYRADGTNATGAYIRQAGTAGTLDIGVLNAKQAIHIDPSGNIGIGTVSPLNKLHVVGSGHFESDALTNITLKGYSNVATDSGSLTLLKATGSMASSGAVATGDRLGSIWLGGQRPNATNINSVSIEARSEEAFTNTSSASYLSFNITPINSTSRSEVMRLSSGGNVGIGTTTPTSPLQLGRVFSFEQDINSGYIGANFGSGTGGNYLVTGNYAVQQMFDSATGAIIFKNAPIGTAGNAISYNERMRIAPSGNVGIGTTTPGAPLEVNGDGIFIGDGSVPNAPTKEGFFFGKSATDTNRRMEIISPVAGQSYIDFTNPNVDYMGRILYNTSSNYFSFFTNTTEKMRIDTSGNVGIGTTGPGSKLDVVGSITGNYLTLRAEGGGAGAEGGQLTLNSSTGYQNVNMDVYNSTLRFHSAYAGAVFTLAMDTGNLTISGTLSQASDRRLKRNIRPLENSLDKILKLQGVSYDWIPEKHNPTPQIGFIAQEVEKIYPEVVLTSDKGIKSVAYQNLVGPIIEAVKKLYTMITSIFTSTEMNTRAIASVDAKSNAQKLEILKLKKENEEMKLRLKKIEEKLNQKSQ